MTSTHIRSVVAGHEAGVLAELGASTFRETFGHLYQAQDLAAFLAHKHTVAEYEQLIADPAAAVWIVEDGDGSAVGYATAKPCDLPVPNLPPRSGELQRLYLRREFQGAGIGRRLLAIVLDWLTERFDAIYLSVYQDNHGAQRLYRSHGFEVVHEYHFMVGDHADPEYIMGRVAGS